MRPAKHISALFAILAMTATTLLVPASPASAAVTKFRTISVNIGSGADNDLNDDGLFAGFGTAEDPLTLLVDQINSFQPDAVMVQEACGRDYARMKALYPSHYFGDFVWQQEGSDDPAHYENSCEKTSANHAREQKGNFTMSRWPIVGQSVEVLPVVPVAGTADSARGTRKARRHTLSGTAILWGSGGAYGYVDLFNTHLTAGSDPDDVTSRQNSAKRIRDLLNTFQVGRKVVLAGDFNDAPKSYTIDQLHRVKRDGSGINEDDKFWETDMEKTQKANADGTSTIANCATSFGVCRDGHWTLPGSKRKSDYIFYGHDMVQAKFSVSGAVESTKTSAHHLLRGSVEFIVG